MDCEKVQENLSAYLDGELSPQEADAIRAHLESCEDCAAEAESLRSTVRLVRSLERVQAPAVLKRRVMAAAGGRRASYGFPNALALVTAAAIVLVAVVAVFMLSAPEPPRGDLTPARLKPEADDEAQVRETGHVSKAAPGRFKKEGISGAPGKTSESLAKTPASDSEFREYDKKNAYGLENGIAGEKEKLADESRPVERAPARTEKSFGSDDSQRQQATLPAEDSKGQMARRLEEFTKQLKGKEGKAETEPVEKLAELEEEPAAEPAAPEVVPPTEELAQAREKLRAGRHGGGGLDPHELKKEEQDLGKSREAGARIEEIVLETENVGLTAEAVHRLLADYESARQAGDKAVSKELPDTSAGMEKTDEESVVLLVHVNSREYRELVDKLELLRTAYPIRAKKAETERGAQEKKDAAKDNWGGASRKESGEARKKVGPERRRSAPGPASPGTGKALEKPESPPPAPEDSFSRQKREANGKKKTENEAKKPAGEDRLKQKKSMDAPEEEPLEEDAGGPAPSQTEPRPEGPAALEGAAGEIVVLRIRIVRTMKPEADLLKKAAEPARPELKQGK